MFPRTATGTIVVCAASWLSFLCAGSARAAGDDAATLAKGAIQERKYEPKHEVRLAIGYLPQDPFYKALGPDLAYTWHRSETFSWEIARVAAYTTYDSDIRRTLRNEFDARKDPYEKPQFMVASHVQWTPFYGRYTFMNRGVLHQEMYFATGAAMWGWQKPADGPNAGTGGGVRPAVDGGFGFRWYASSRMSVKLELLEDFFMRSDGSIGDQFYLSLGGAWSTPRRRR